jgi:hypothetical protein
MPKTIGSSFRQSLQHHIGSALCSHYYWREDPGNQPITTLRRQLLAEDWSVREFALCPRLRNIYSEFLHGMQACCRRRNWRINLPGLQGPTILTFARLLGSNY